MKRMKFLIAMLAMALVFGMAGCDDVLDEFQKGLNGAETPAYSVVLSEEEAYVFKSAETELALLVVNSGDEATGALTAELTGDSEAFTLSKTELPSIKAGKSGKLVIAPVAGLAAGTYEAAVVLSGEAGIAATLDVSYTVGKAAEPEAEAAASEETTDEEDAATDVETESGEEAVVTDEGKERGDDAVTDGKTETDEGDDAAKHGEGKTEAVTEPETESVTEEPEAAETVYTVTFNTNGGGTPPASQTVAHGDTVINPVYPTRVGYAFNGWYTSAALTTRWDFNTPVTTNITLYAKWVATDLTVTFDTQGGTLGNFTQAVKYGSKLKRPDDPVKPDYTFVGWYWDSYSGILEWQFDGDQATADFTIFAKWKSPSDPDYCTVTFDLQGGYKTGIPETVTVAYGGQTQLPHSPYKPYYNFDWWYMDADFTVPFWGHIPIFEDVTVYAKWIPQGE